jgi:indolepyruvate ferredoxin oxidoreductase
VDATAAKARLPTQHSIAGTAMSVLALHEGRCLLWGAQALLKGILEADREVHLLVGPRAGAESFAGIFQAASDELVAALLKKHGTTIATALTARRSIALAHQAACGGAGAGGVAAAGGGRWTMSLVPNEHLDSAMPALTAVMEKPLPPGAAMCIIMEDQPLRYPASCPRMAASRVGMACIEPADPGQLRDIIEHAFRLSRAGGSPIALVVHASIMRSAQTMEARPNRVTDTADVMLSRRRRKPRVAEISGLLRMARRIEINQIRALPSPGEHVPVGFMTVGPAHTALMHLTHELRLHGRVPVLQLGLLNPIDDAALSRFLMRCDRAIVLEPRPGVVKSHVLAIAEAMRRRGESPASLWGRMLPPKPGDGADISPFRPDEALHPSRLARRIVHLLHMIRPTMQVSKRLLPDEVPPSGDAAASPPTPAATSSPSFGSAAAMALLRRMVTDLDQWLRSQAPLEERGLMRTVLAIDGVEPADAASAAKAASVAGGQSRGVRIVPLELVDGRQFIEIATAAVPQAARDERPWIMVVCEIDTADLPDAERLARALVPAERAEQVRIETANLNDRAALRDALREAAMRSGTTVIIVRDGPPPTFDPGAIERALAEIDALGFEPRRQASWPADEACDLRPPAEEPTELDEGRESALRPLKTEVRVTQLAHQSPKTVRVRIQPLLEQVEVMRTRPPVWTHAARGAMKLDLPEPIHARSEQWRFHQAGIRSASGAAAGMGVPLGVGPAAWALCQAGRSMGYEVSAVYDPTPVGPGRRAWAQVLFTRRSTGDDAARSLPASSRRSIAPSLSAMIPYGEADLLLGIDGGETLRAVALDADGFPLRVAHESRTHAIANSGEFAVEASLGTMAGGALSRGRIAAALGAVTRHEHATVEDFAAACRAWFHTDRVTDLAMLGLAYQRGYVPVTLEHIETAVRRVEQAGFGRSMEAFQFGRRLAVDGRLLSRPTPSPGEEDIERLVRRIVLSIRQAPFVGRRRAQRFEHLLEQALLSMPGLSETAPGRQARRDLVGALYRMLEWGGFNYAQQYAQLIMELYRADRGDRGRGVTRNAVLPLADAMLIRDPVYVACMAGSMEHRRRTRQRLNVKPARGDHVERRYLTRLELIAFQRRYRADVRTSDWPTRVARAVRLVAPSRWRGTRREREIRSYVMDFVQRARFGCAAHYELWADAMSRLHHHAAEERLRDMALAELRMLTSAVDFPPDAPPPADVESPQSRRDRKVELKA